MLRVQGMYEKNVKAGKVYQKETAKGWESMSNCDKSVPKSEKVWKRLMNNDKVCQN